MFSKTDKQILKIKYLQQQLVGFLISKKGLIIDDHIINLFSNEFTHVLDNQYNLSKTTSLNKWKEDVYNQASLTAEAYRLDELDINREAKSNARYAASLSSKIGMKSRYDKDKTKKEKKLRWNPSLTKVKYVKPIPYQSAKDYMIENRMIDKLIEDEYKKKQEKKRELDQNLVKQIMADPALGGKKKFKSKKTLKIHNKSKKYTQKNKQK